MTHTFNLNGRAIRLIISHEGRKYKKATGLTIDPALWNQKARSLRAKCKDAKVYERLRLIDLRMAEKEATGEVPPEEAIIYAIYGEDAAESPEIGREKEKGTGVSFYEYFDEWANRETPQKRQRRNTLKLIRECMGDSWDWADIDTAFFFRLVQKLKARDYSVNYIGSIAKKLKTVMSEGYKLKYHTNTDYRQFSAPMEEASTVYLTREEVDRLWNLGLSDDTERKCRDLFLLGCYTAMRFSDYSRLTLDNIRDGMIYFTQKKTAGRVVVPASPRVLAILKRNGGEAPKVGQEVLNRTIKVVCFKARIFDKVEVTKSKGGRHETRLVEKYTQVSSHTARRTAATLLYQSGVPASAVMQLTGHKTETDFYRYIRTTREENARMLADNPFFK
ncbi:MAG: tyrosine-type recombinase/integrase [Bacteroidales bacterium]|nr:tyrosine-type recombinase/integrase [Bacteroidales bacterium]